MWFLFKLTSRFKKKKYIYISLFFDCFYYYMYINLHSGESNKIWVGTYEKLDIGTLLKYLIFRVSFENMYCYNV